MKHFQSIAVDLLFTWFRKTYLSDIGNCICELEHVLDTHNYIPCFRWRFFVFNSHKSAVKINGCTTFLVLNLIWSYISLDFYSSDCWLSVNIEASFPYISIVQTVDCLWITGLKIRCLNNLLIDNCLVLKPKVLDRTSLFLNKEDCIIKAANSYITANCFTSGSWRYFSLLKKRFKKIEFSACWVEVCPWAPVFFFYVLLVVLQLRVL